MAILGLPKKELKKTALDLIDLHQRVILHWLIEQDIEYQVRQKFWVIYHHYVNIKNIYSFFHLPVRVFVIYLLRDELDHFITPKRKKTHKRRK